MRTAACEIFGGACMNRAYECATKSMEGRSCTGLAEKRPHQQAKLARRVNHRSRCASLSVAKPRCDARPAFKRSTIRVNEDLVPATWCVHVGSSKVRYVRYTSDLTTFRKVSDREMLSSRSQRHWPRGGAPSNFAAGTPMTTSLRYRVFGHPHKETPFSHYGSPIGSFTRRRQL